jgi:hypothetical protein
MEKKFRKMSFGAKNMKELIKRGCECGIEPSRCVIWETIEWVQNWWLLE